MRKSGQAKSARFTEAADGSATGTRFDRGHGDGRGTHAIGLGLDDGRDARTRLGSGLECTDISSDGVEVDLDPGKHCLESIGGHRERIGHNSRTHDGYAPD
jgi:hypothetical protein